MGAATMLRGREVGTTASAEEEMMPRWDLKDGKELPKERGGAKAGPGPSTGWGPAHSLCSH